ncbi:hypothetical protein JW824_07225 [bacterium]|nr:hypothetical protein [bacterium]
MGFPVWGADTGGYLGTGRIDETLYIRWLQWGAWNGMFEIKIDGSGGSGEDRPPWKYTERLQNVFREVCEQRMALLPTIYSCANTSYVNGVLMKPLNYLYPHDENAYQIWDEYIFGNGFLVAPVFTPDNVREIYLPDGKWIDFYDHTKTVTGPVTLLQTVPLETIPVFIKENSIYITGQIFQGNSKIWEGELDGNEMITIHILPGNINDQTTFRFVDSFDNDKEKIMHFTRKSDQMIFSSDRLMVQSTIELKCTSRPAKVLLNGENTAYEYNDSLQIVKTNIGKNREINLEIIFSD